MRLIRFDVPPGQREAGLLQGFSFGLDDPVDPKKYSDLATLCLVGHNGSGKSQFLQVLAEVFQDAWHRCSPEAERVASSTSFDFELEYACTRDDDSEVIVRLVRNARQHGNRQVRMFVMNDEWAEVEAGHGASFSSLLPPVIVGYTSGDNETLSLPFFRSRAAYAKDVRTAALDEKRRLDEIPDSKLLLIDYGTHLEVLIANLMLGQSSERARLLKHTGLRNLSSWRCVVQLRPPGLTARAAKNGRRWIALTDELETTLSRLASCATLASVDESNDTYTFDFAVNDEMRKAFRFFWPDAISLYKAFHKLAMLNDLAVPKRSRDRLSRQIANGNFAVRLPEPQDEQKVFRFENVRFTSPAASVGDVDYVSLSDGEHQLAQVLGVFSMIRSRNALFLMDEPESHFNPQWRVRFVSRIRETSLRAPSRGVVLTTHAPFVPSDLHSEQVLIMSRDGVSIDARRPAIETYGANFDRILRACFGIDPPISGVARDEIERLMKSNSSSEIEAASSHIGASVERSLLMDRARQLRAGEV